MRTITKEFKIYKYDELSEDSKEKVINDYIESWLCLTNFETLNKNTNLYKAIKKAEEMQTPWFEMQYVWDYCKKDILKNVKRDEYYENGSVFCG